MIILKTERLTLRKFTPGNAEFIIKLLNSPGWLKYIGTRNINSIDDAQDYISTKLIPSYEKNGFGFYLMETKSDNIPVGMCGLIKRDGLDDVDIGFALLPEHEGNGYAYEAASATLVYAKEKLKLKRIAAITVPYNISSIKLLEKIGLAFEKMLNIPNDKEELMLYTISYE